MSNFAPPFELQQVFFVRCIVLAIPEFKEDSEHEAAPPENTIEVQRDKDNANRFLCSMRTIINPEKAPKFPYSIDIECVCGLVQIDTELDETTASRGATITAHSVLYGAIRETVSWLTARQPWGAHHLGLSTLRPGAPPQKAQAPDPPAE